MTTNPNTGVEIRVAKAPVIDWQGAFYAIARQLDRIERYVVLRSRGVVITNTLEDGDVVLYDDDAKDRWA